MNIYKVTTNEPYGRDEYDAVVDAFFHIFK